MPIYMCAVDKLLCEFIWDSFVYSDATPLLPLVLPTREHPTANYAILST